MTPTRTRIFETVYHDATRTDTGPAQGVILGLIAGASAWLAAAAVVAWACSGVV